MADEGDSAEAEVDAEHGAFAYLALEGRRFNRPGMPTSSTREIELFRKAIYEVARRIYLDRNPDRKNVPDGFDAAFDLRLTTVLPGSARPQLVLDRPADVTDYIWDEWYEIFSEARDSVTRSVRQVKQTKGDTDLSSLGPRARSAISKIGSSLKDNEVVVVGHPTVPQRRARLDTDARQYLRRAESVISAPVQPETVTLTGVIVEYDGVGQSFDLRTENGISRCVLEWFNQDLANFARDVLALDGVTAPDVSVQGETLDVGRKTIQLFNVHTINIVRGVEEKALAQRVAKLSELEDGWWGPDSIAPQPEVLDKLQLVLSDLSGLGIDVDLVPSSDGSVMIEISRGDTELTVIIAPIAGMTLIRDNTETDELWEVDAPFDPQVLTEFLRRGVVDQ